MKKLLIALILSLASTSALAGGLLVHCKGVRNADSLDIKVYRKNSEQINFYYYGSKASYYTHVYRTDKGFKNIILPYILKLEIADKPLRTGLFPARFKETGIMGFGSWSEVLCEVTDAYFESY